MARYRYDDKTPRYYPDHALNAEPGKTYELTAAPDKRFTKVGSGAAATRRRAPSTTSRRTSRRPATAPAAAPPADHAADHTAVPAAPEE